MAVSVLGNKAVVLRYYEETHNRRNVGVVDELCALEYGEDRRRWLEMAYAALPDASFTVEDVIADGDEVALRYSGRGTHRGGLLTPLGTIPPTGRQVTTSGILVYRLAGGKLVQEWVRVDWLGLLQQLGVVLAADQAPSTC